jgi:hypothetical protein
MSSNTVIQVKKSGTTGNTPASLNYGELALNWADGKLFYKNGVGIKAIYNQKTFSTINANNTLILAGSYTDTLSIIAGNNVTIDSDSINKTITINSSGGAMYSNSFGVISAAGYDDIVANNSNTRLTFDAQLGLAIATDPTNTKISFATNLIGAANVILDYGSVQGDIGTITFDYGYVS